MTVDEPTVHTQVAEKEPQLEIEENSWGNITKIKLNSIGANVPINPIHRKNIKQRNQDFKSLQNK